jgi:pilus assembly protein CpaB
MAISRKSKKKNTRLIIALGVAVLLMVILFMLFSGLGGQITQVSQSKQHLEAQIKTLQEELDEQKRAAKLAARTTSLARPVQEEQKNTLNVVIASKPIEAGTRLSHEIMDVKEWPAEAVPVNAFNYPESLLGRIVSADVASGEPILPNKLIDKDTQTLEIPPGYRAITLPVDNISGVGGFLMPGSRVDLLTVVPKSTDGKSNEKVSKLLIQNVRVLATSSGSAATSRGPRAAKEEKSSTITIAIPAQDATKVALAYDNGNGNIQVILRSFQDNTEVDKVATDTGELITGNISLDNQDIVIPDIDLPRPPTDGYSSGTNIDLNSIINDADGLPPPTPPTAQTRTHSIEVIQANSRQEVSFETEI